MPLAPETFAGRVWRFGREDGQVFARDLILHPGGRIGNFAADNEVGWRLEDGLVCFVNARGSVTTKFSSVQIRDDGSLFLRGRFRLATREDLWFFLDEHTSPPAEIVGRFENIGDNCEFGLVQRYFGCEPLGLLRFNWVGMDKLLLGLDNGFAGLEHPDNLHLRPDAAGEYLVHDHRYGFAYHSGRHVGQIAADELLRNEAVRLTFLKRKLFDDLRAAEKIFVRKGTDSATLQDVVPLHRRLRAFGHGTLLWVVAANTETQVGTVEHVEDGLLRGYVRRFAPYTFAAELDADGWGRLCKAAHVLTFATT